MPWSSLQTDVVERPPENNANAEANTKDGIEIFRLCASLFRAHFLIIT
jgi:hypothetical protein